MKKKLSIALLVIAVMVVSFFSISWKKDPAAKSVQVKSFYSLSNGSSEEQLRTFIQTNKLKKEDIISVSNSAAYSPGEGIYHTFLITFNK
jgi:hypothetical protein